MKRGLLKNKKAMEMEMLGWWISAIAVLVVMIGGYIILKVKGIDTLEFVKNLLRFGR